MSNQWKHSSTYPFIFSSFLQPYPPPLLSPLSPLSLPHSSGVILRVLFHPKQLQLITACDDGEIKVWDLVTKSCVATLKGHVSPVTSLSLSSDGWSLVAGGRDSVVTVWDLRTHQRTATVPVYEAVEAVLALPPSSPLIPTNNNNNNNDDDDDEHSGKKGSRRKGEKTTSTTTNISTKSDYGLVFATGGDKGIIRLWDAATARCIYDQSKDVSNQSIITTAAGGVVELAVLPKGAGIMSATEDCRILFFKNKKPPPSSLLSLQLERHLIGNNDEVTDMCFIPTTASSSSSSSSSPPLIAVATNSEHIRLFDSSTMSCVGSLAGHKDTVLALDTIQLPGTGQSLLVSGSKDATLRVWTVPEGRCVAVGQGHVSAVSAVAFSKSNAKQPESSSGGGGGPSLFVVSGGSDKLLKVWDLSAIPAALRQQSSNDDEDGSEEGEEEGKKDSFIIKLKVTAAVAAHDKDINAIAISPNNKLVVSGSQDKTANIWHLPSLVSASPPLKGHKRGIWSVAFSPLDQAVATASGDKTIRIWSLHDGSCLRVLEGHLSSVLRVCFTSAGMQLLSSGGDGLIKLWSVRSSECVSTFDGHDDKVWALAPLITSDTTDDNNTTSSDARLIASGGGDGSIVLWEDCTSEDALVAAKEREAAILGEQALANALAGEKYADAAVMALNMRHPGRLLSVIRRVTEKNSPEQAHIIIIDILKMLKKKKNKTIEKGNNGGGDDDDDTEHHNNKNEELRQLLEYCKDWNTNAKTCSAAQAVMYSLFKAYSPEDLLSTPGVSAVLDALVPYSQRHFKRADRLLRGTFLVDFILGSNLNTLNPDDDDDDSGGGGSIRENGKLHNDNDDDNEEKGKESDKKTKKKKKRKAGS